MSLSRLLLSLLLLGASSLIAQPLQTLTRIPVDLDRGGEVFVFSDENGALLLIQEGQQAEVLQLGPDLTVEHQFKVLNFPAPEAVDRMGFTYAEGELTICYRNRQDSQVVALWIVPAEEKSKQINLGLRQLLSGSTPWDNFTYEGALHMLRFGRGRGEIRVCRFEGGDQFETMSFPLMHAAQLRGQRLQFTRIDSSRLTEVGTTYHPSKMYLRDGQVYFTLDQSNRTYLIHLDLERMQVEEHLLSLDTDLLTPNKMTSLVADDQFYQVAMVGSQLYWWASPLSQLGDLVPPVRPNSILTLPENSDGYWVSPSGTEAADLLPYELWAAWEEAPHFALAATPIQYDEPQLIYLAGVWPLNSQGLTGMVVSQSVRSLQRAAYVDPFTGQLQIDANPRPLITEAQSPRKPPHAHTFQIGAQTFQGYYDEASQSYVIGR